MPQKRTMPPCATCGGPLPRRTHAAGVVRLFCTRTCYRASQTPKLRFRDKVAAQPTEDGCLRWLGGFFDSGYGAFGLNGKTERAHVVAYLWSGRTIPDGYEVCHTCAGGGNRWCVNPNHLIAASHMTNVQHAIDARRTLIGTKNHKAKLADTDIVAIRRQWSAGESLASLARRYAVTKQTIWGIVHHKTWKHVV